MECLALVESCELDPVETYVPKQQHCLILSLREDLAEHIDTPCKIMTLSNLEDCISLARERR